jgi:hypothetical protein
MPSPVSPGSFRLLAIFAVLVGVFGMFASFRYLASGDIGDIVAGAAGFVAGSVLVGSGLISLALVALADSRSGYEPDPDDE